MSTSRRDSEDSIPSLPKKPANHFLVRLRAILDEERERSCTLEANTQIVNIWMERSGHLEENSRVERCAIAEWGGTPVQELYVRRGPLDDVSEVELRNSGCGPWLSARQWFRNRYGEYHIRQVKLEDRWKTTGESFRFMALPVELRIKILRFVVGNRIWPHLKSDCCRDSEKTPEDELPALVDVENSEPEPVWSNPGAEAGAMRSIAIERDCVDVSWLKLLGIHAPFETQDFRFWTPTEQHPGRGIDLNQLEASQVTSMLGVSKQFQQELEEVIWGRDTMQRFNRWDILASTTRALLHLGNRTPLLANFTMLRWVSLNLTNYEYFQLIGFESTPGEGFARHDRLHDARLDSLTKIKTLDHLNFQFQVWRPIVYVDDGFSFDPWSNNIRPSLGLTVSCQKVWVDWFFTLAYYELRRVPKFTFSGHVKNSVRSKWEAIFCEPRKGPGRDMSSEVEVILSTPVEALPPACHCLIPCAWWSTPEPEMGGGPQPPPYEWSCED